MYGVDADILLLHCPITEFIKYPAENAYGVEDLPTEKFKYIFVGDTHVTSEVVAKDCTVISPGSTEMNKTDEPANKYFYSVEKDLLTGAWSHDKHLIETRPVVTADINTEEDLEATIAVLKQHEDKHPMLFGRFLTTVDNVLDRINKTVNTNKVYMRLHGKGVKDVKSFLSERAVQPLSNYVSEHIKPTEPHYELAVKLCDTKTDGTDVIDAYVNSKCPGLADKLKKNTVLETK